MWIEIIQVCCPWKRHWYVNKIGQRFKASELKAGFYTVRDDKGFTNFIDEKDARIVE